MEMNAPTLPSGDDALFIFPLRIAGQSSPASFISLLKCWPIPPLCWFCHLLLTLSLSLSFLICGVGIIAQGHESLSEFLYVKHCVDFKMLYKWTQLFRYKTREKMGHLSLSNLTAWQ